MAKNKIKQDLKANNKLLYDSMLDIHKHIFEQQRYAETKNSILLTLSLAILAVYARLFFVAKDSLLSNLCFLILFFVPLVSLIPTLFFILQSFKPNLSNRENVSDKSNKNEQSIQPNIYFFEYLCKIKSDDLIHKMKNMIDCKNTSNIEQIRDLANQICVLSQITAQKHKYFNKAMFWVKIFICTMLIACVLFCVLYFVDIQIHDYLNCNKETE